MAIAQSRITAHGQISVPAEVRRKLGVGPGSILEWDESDGHVVVRRGGRHSSLEIHEALFANETAKSPIGVNDGIRKRARAKYARC